MWFFHIFAEAAPCISLLFHKFPTFCCFLNVLITLQNVLSVLISAYQCTTVFVCDYVCFDGRQLSLLLGVPHCSHGIAVFSEKSLGFFSCAFSFVCAVTRRCPPPPLFFSLLQGFHDFSRN